MTHIDNTPTNRAIAVVAETLLGNWPMAETVVKKLLDAGLLNNDQRPPSRSVVEIAREARRQALDDIETIVQKWDPRSERWNDMPYDTVDIKTIILGNINRLRALPDEEEPT